MGDLFGRHEHRQLLEALIGDLDRRHVLAAGVAVLGVAGGQGVENSRLAGLGRADYGEVHATPPFTPRSAYERPAPGVKERFAWPRLRVGRSTRRPA